MNLDIDALRTFVAVAEHRNFTRAGDVVARTQSTVSMQIKNLEGRLGFALFERTKRSVALTERGEKFGSIKLVDGKLIQTMKVSGAQYEIPPVKGTACLQNPDEQASHYCHECHAVKRDK